MGLASVIGGAAGLGLGAIRNNQKRAAYNREKELAAQTAAYSPWTGLNGMAAMPKERPDLFGDLLQGGLSGGMMGNNFTSMFGGGAAPAAAKGSWGDLMGVQSAGGFEGAPDLFDDNLKGPYAGLRMRA